MKRYCRNCYTPLPKKATFCVECGQKDSNGKVRMRTMLLKLWNSTFHLEGKFIRTCWQLFIPAKITLEFFKGKQGRYPHPLRMFAVVMFLFLFMFNMLMKDRRQGEEEGLLTVTTKVSTEHGDSILLKKKVPFFETVKQRTLLNDMRQDFKQLPEEWQTAESRKAIDSIINQTRIRYGGESDTLPESLASQLDTTTINFVTTQLKIATADIVRYDADEIIRRYHVTHWGMKLLVRQTIKSLKSPEGLVHAYIGSLTWAILALVALMSGFLALLYRRQRRFYVEHFIFLLHYHTGIMLAALLAIVGMLFHLWEASSIGLVFLWATISMFIAMRRYYRQSVGKTVLKWLIYGFVYYISFGMLFIMGAVLVFAIY